MKNQKAITHLKGENICSITKEQKQKNSKKGEGHAQESGQEPTERGRKQMLLSIPRAYNKA
jgi:hypothetical protein